MLDNSPLDISEKLKRQLFKNEEALIYFKSLPEDAKMAVIEKSASIQSENKLKSYVDNLFDINEI